MRPGLPGLWECGGSPLARDDTNSRRAHEAKAAEGTPGNRFFVEFDHDDPEALRQEWNYTDRAMRLYRAGHRLLTRGYFVEADEVFERATRYDRSHYAAYVGRSEALVVLGEYDAAARVVNNALDRFGRNSQLGAARGHVFLHQQDLESASQCLGIASQGAPQSAYVWLILGEARLVMGDGFAAAKGCFDRARRAPVRWAFLELRMALALLEWGATEECRAHLMRLLEDHPDLPLAWILLGDAERLLGNERGWRKCYEHAYHLVPNLDALRQALSLKSRAGKAWRKALGVATRVLPGR